MNAAQNFLKVAFTNSLVKELFMEEFSYMLSFKMTLYVQCHAQAFIKIKVTWFEVLLSIKSQIHFSVTEWSLPDHVVNK